MKNRAPIAAVLLILFLTGCGHTLTREEAEKKLKEHLEQTEPFVKATLNIGGHDFHRFPSEEEPGSTIYDNSFGDNSDLDTLANNNVMIATVIADVPAHDVTQEHNVDLGTVAGVNCTIREEPTVLHLRGYKITKYKLNPDIPAEAKNNIVEFYDRNYYSQLTKFMVVKLGILAKVKCTGLTQEPNSNTCNAEFEVEYEPTTYGTMGFNLEPGFTRTKTMNVTFTRYDDGWRM